VACLREALATAAVGPRHLTVATIKSNLANWLVRDERTRREALAAFGQPYQGGPREEIPLVRRWLARQGCRRGP
jgi:hypothetical protein